MSLGRRLPPGARFATVGELFGLPADESARTEYWCTSRGSSLDWAPVDRLLVRRSSAEATLALTPSGMVLVVRTVPS